MNTAVITTKIDPQTKKEAQKAAEAIGMPLSVIIKAFLKYFVETKTIFFSLRYKDANEYLNSVIKQAQSDWKKQKQKHRP